MSHRLLFDANLAPRLVDLLEAAFPGSLHVRDLDLERALDVDVLRAAEGSEPRDRHEGPGRCPSHG